MVLESVLAAKHREIAERVNSIWANAGMIVVMGWRNDCHTTVTRALPQHKVRFFTERGPPQEIPEVAQLLMHPSSVNNKHLARVRKLCTIPKCSLSRSLTAQILEYALHVAPTESGAASASVPNVSDVSDLLAVKAEAPDIRNSTTISEGAASAMDKTREERFASAFRRKVADVGQSGSISSRALAEIIVELHLPLTAQKLIKMGWVIAVKASPEMKKKTLYSLGAIVERALTLATKLPSNAFESATALIQQKEQLQSEEQRLLVCIEAETARHNQELSRLNSEKQLVLDRLTKLATAKQLLTELEKIMETSM
ncbi:MAG: hypothetical protein JWN18_336 [Parcubacteria group bacterium]|nr:hypothetical protein [Parcubacteria group bacterium]